MLAGHSGATLPLALTLGDTWTRRLEPLVDATTGVQVFFVLSGFLITRLLADELARTGRVRLGRFAARRLLRLGPPFAVLLLVVAGLAAAGLLAPRYTRGFGWAAVYAYNVVARADTSTVLASTWSLAIEEQFYLVWPALLLLARRRPLVLLAVASAGLVALDLTLEHSVWASTHRVDRWPPAVFPTLFAGCAAALLVRRGITPRRWGPWLAAAAVAYGVSLWAPDLARPFAYGVRSAGITVGVVWVVTHPASRIVGLLEWRPLRAAGRLSYALYLWQSLFLTTNPTVWAGPYDFGASYAANAARAVRDGGMAMAWLPPINLILTALAAVATYHGVERPALRLRARLVGRNPRRPDGGYGLTGSDTPPS